MKFNSNIFIVLSLLIFFTKVESKEVELKGETIAEKHENFEIISSLINDDNNSTNDNSTNNNTNDNSTNNNTNDNTTNNNTNDKDKNDKNTNSWSTKEIIIYSSIGAVVLVLLIIVIILAVCLCRTKNKNERLSKEVKTTSFQDERLI